MMHRPLLSVILRSAARPAAVSANSGALFASSALQQRFASSASNYVPSIAQQSLWASLVPKFLREKKRPQKGQKKQSLMDSLATNPATFFIVMFILIGSMSINLLGMRNEFKTFTRRTDTRIELLREVIGQLQAGEKIDVDRALGTGDEAQEKEWEDMVNQLTSGISAKQEQPKEEKQAEKAEPAPEPVTEAQPIKSKGFSSFF